MPITMPRKKSCSENQPSEYSVEIQRLQALVDTQRRHVEELNKQLHETLEAKRQQQLQLVERSPAPRNVKQLLAKAAADNTALAKKVEELRAQRNALAVTKAALTAQLSELIRGAADDAQREQQNYMLLHQLQQLCCYIGRRDLQDPGHQMAAVIKHVHKAQQTQQVLVQEVENYKQAVTVSAVTDASVMLSPTGGRSLDQTSTSELVWDSSRYHDMCPAAATGASIASAAAAVDVTPAVDGCSNWSASCKTAKSYLTDLSYISPLRTSSKAGHERAPCTLTPDTAAATAGSEIAHCTAFMDENDSPLSTQSLSIFSPGKAAALRSCINPRRLDLATPVSQYAPEPTGRSSSSESDSCMHLRSKDAQQQDQKLQQIDSSDSPQLSMMMMSPVFGFDPTNMQCPSTSRPAAGAGAAHHAAAETAQRTTGLSLEAEFRLAACGSLWPSPALTGASVAGVPGSGMRTGNWPSHMLLQQDAGATSPVPARVLSLDFSPLATHLGGGCRLRAVSPLGVWFGEEGCYDLGLDTEQEQQQLGSKARCWLVIGLCVVAPFTVAAAAGGAAAWHFKRDEVLDFIKAVRCGAGWAAKQTQRGATAGWGQCQRKAAAAWARAKQCLQAQTK